ncbi:interferon-inducible double-stranded RNA-dependent protein kinase activator A-like [Cataglyphis hispanica]|uniref:interferon-inducible double-stranded RNA-dependent protein kinase activator A-like n=1 Tax=Cataglyphis hispanica TaxID=1086592 RepID=UPI002180387B|nr:interferon-inducible double-stranded RNA-dependent protein kinase activator A-like [Cataglyphis hispanica]
MSKTPVSILQEMMVKQGMIPDYELIHDGGGRHVNTFTYRVICDGLTATGTGRCKKEAKHEAATAMLIEIANHRNYPQLPAANTPAVSPSRSPFHSVPLPPKIPANVPFVNAIGELQDLCAENNLLEPEYVLTKDSGPPHARIFTIQCRVSSFVEEGVASTKKQAKHEAARKMVELIKDLVNQVNSTKDKEECAKSSKSSITTDQIEIVNRSAEECYHAVTKSIRKINLGLKCSEYHIKWRDSLEMDKRNKILNELHCIHFNETYDDVDQFNKKIEETLSRLEIILSEINVTINIKDIIAENNYFMKSIELMTCPILTQIGMGKTNLEAFKNALSQMIECLELLLS